MKHSTTLLFSIATLLLFSQVLSSNRFLAQDDKPNAAALHLPANASAPHDDNHTHGPAPNNNSNNASFPPHHPEGHERPHPPGNNSNFNNASAPHHDDANATRLLPSVNNSNANHGRAAGKRANDTDAKKSKDHGHPGKQDSHHANASAPHHDDANATRLLPSAKNSNAGERGNATHAIRPRGSAPKWNETERARGSNASRGAGGKAHRSNATHAFNGENGEDNLEHVTRKLREAMDKAFNLTSHAKGNQDHGRKPIGKGQNHAQGRNHTNSGEDHFGGHVWDNENGEEVVHAWNSTKKA